MSSYVSRALILKRLLLYFLVTGRVSILVRALQVVACAAAALAIAPRTILVLEPTRLDEDCYEDRGDEAGDMF